MQKNLFQYSVKVVQGTIPDPNKLMQLGNGIYFTSVNVHNPWRKKVKYAVKFAVSGKDGKPGVITPFQIQNLGPDGVTQFDLQGFEYLLQSTTPPTSMPGFLEGYLVIESEEEFDVVGVYTGSAVQDRRLGAMHMERVPARLIPYCKDLVKDLSTGFASWMLIKVPDNCVGLQLGEAPKCDKNQGWIDPPSKTQSSWVGNNKDASSGDYIYSLEFCLCWDFKDAKIQGKLWADNLGTAYINGLPVPNGATDATYGFKGPGLDLVITDNFKPGLNTLNITVKNISGPTGLLFAGTLTALLADCNS